MENEEVIDLMYLFRILKKHLLFVGLIGVICAVAAFVLSEFVMTKKYESKALLYVENSQQTSESVNINDINAAQKLVNTCQIIFKSGTVMDNLIANLDLPYTKEQLNGMITASSVNSTEVMQLVVESTDPGEAEEIVNELVRLANIEFLRVIKSGSLEVIDYGEIDTRPSFPNVTLITAAGFLLGLVAAYIIVFVNDMLDVVVKHDDNLAKLYGIPVFAEITDFLSANESKYGYSRYGYGYGYGYGKKPVKQKTETAAAGTERADRLLSESTPFAITEAYNTARTNIMFAASTSRQKIVAVTSSNPSEGKSTTCANIAISFANAGFKTLLVECDLRKPVMAKSFGVKPKKGLSSILGGFCTVSEAICPEVMSNLDIITTGDIPPNPSELLASDSMKIFLKASSDDYDYVFLDTPPVNVVTDSQLMNTEIAGLVFVIREGSTIHPDIQSAIEKIQLANGKALGFVKTFCKPEKSGRYGKKYSYSKYGYKYGYGYGYEYSSKNSGGDAESAGE
ncbi:MAG: polysaccharide biosynthesis tyrosine autokinase [Eubacterium sp.]|nr:polysaccharide biosynthesis tyrosine autokinase [Eubacterium sp.]